MAVAGLEGMGRVASPIPGVAELTDLAHETSDFLRNTGREGADAMRAAGNAGQIVLAGGMGGAIAGVGAEKLSKELKIGDPETAGQIASIGVGAAIGYAMAKGGALGAVGGPWGIVGGALIGGAAGLITYYALR
jgi:hypothetical protein